MTWRHRSPSCSCHTLWAALKVGLHLTESRRQCLSKISHLRSSIRSKERKKEWRKNTYSLKKKLQEFFWGASCVLMPVSKLWHNSKTRYEMFWKKMISGESTLWHWGVQFSSLKDERPLSISREFFLSLPTLWLFPVPSLFPWWLLYNSLPAFLIKKTRLHPHNMWGQEK